MHSLLFALCMFIFAIVIQINATILWRCFRFMRKDSKHSSKKVEYVNVVNGEVLDPSIIKNMKKQSRNK